MRAWLCLLLAACDGSSSLEKDKDGDGVEDQFDKCPSIADDQTDTDLDGTGDACDRCPLAAHDEDVDGTDDPCDPCPADRYDDDSDLDGDGVGDGCDPFTKGGKAMPSRRLLFDPFYGPLAPAWKPKTVEWKAIEEHAFPLAPLGPDDGLLYPVQLPASAHVEIGVDFHTISLEPGQVFGIRLVDLSGAEQAVCFVDCTEQDGCQVHTRVGSASANRFAFGGLHTNLRLVVDASTQTTFCFLYSDDPATQVMAVPPAGTQVMLIASPTAKLGYVDVVGHGQ